MDNYTNLIVAVVREGWQVPSRFGDTREIRNLRWDSTPGIIPLRKGHNRKLGYMELLQVMAGVFDEEYMGLAAPNATHSLFTSQMAGGPRIARQPEKIVETLRKDPWSRQCVMFWGKESDSCSSNLPCTVCAEFLLRQDRLHMTVHMRSWDLVRGMPYDLMIFSGLQMTMAKMLGVPTGDLMVTAMSAHVYIKDIEEGKLPISKNMIFGLQWPQDLTWNTVIETCTDQYKRVLDWPTRAPWLVLEGIE